MPDSTAKNKNENGEVEMSCTLLDVLAFIPNVSSSISLCLETPFRISMPERRPLNYKNLELVHSLQACRCLVLEERKATWLQCS